MKNLNIIERLAHGSNILGEYDEIFNIIRFNKKIKIYFSFDWKSYESKIVLEGLDNSFKIFLDVPQIPLAGACASDYVYARMVTGQMYISNLLEMVSFNLDFYANSMNVRKDYGDHKKTEIIKIDRCFYAPFLTRITKEGEIEYSHLLKEKYPEALNELKNLKQLEENYWRKYHDNH